MDERNDRNNEVWYSAKQSHLVQPMKFNYATKRVTNFEYQRNTLLGLTAALLILLIIMGLCLLFRSEKVIVLPPEVRREFWVEGNRFSPEYLEEMAVYFLHLALDVNQTTLPCNIDVLSRYADVETGKRNEHNFIFWRPFHMSGFRVKFIPEDPRFVLNTQTIDEIKNLSWYDDNVSIIVNDTVQFADCGANFEYVLCPFCKSDLMEWWGDAMSKAYSNEAGFINLDVITPCCNKNTTLHNLDYDFPQGFYLTMIEMEPRYHQGVIQVPQELHKEIIRQELFRITGINWRIINTHI